MAEFVERKRWLFFGLPFTFTKYTIKEDMITIDRGFFSKTEDDCYMYKVKDVKLTESFAERLVKVGTIVCYTGADVTNPQLEIKHVKNAKAIKNFILEQSEAERLKRRTINTMNLNADSDIDSDGLVDDAE